MTTRISSLGALILLIVTSACAQQLVATEDTAPSTSTLTSLPPVTETPTSSTAPATTAPEPPPPGPGYELSPREEQYGPKDLAAGIARTLTTYEAGVDYRTVAGSVTRGPAVEGLAEVAAPLAFPDHWSRGRVIYPQMGGLRNGRASVMVVTEQTIGTGAEAERTIVRTLDIRLIEEEGRWVFDRLDSPGGEARDRPQVLAPIAEQVADDPRIGLSDSAYWDIYAGDTSDALLQVMSDLSEQTPYGAVVLSSGHPFHVFETDRQSHHTTGMAIDIYRFGDEAVIDGRHPDSQTRRWVEWLLDHPQVRQVGSPWDLDGGSSSRSFSDEVHQDHVHVAVHG